MYETNDVSLYNYTPLDAFTFLSNAERNRDSEKAQEPVRSKSTSDVRLSLAWL